ncbi:thermonuclease family protein [Thalassoglobus sp.]|uniref:thermonuclease family protein n=1 Tax=Thalassoglobus sp. TaxID=2795869 RepID=UPI003AA9AED4
MASRLKYRKPRPFNFLLLLLLVCWVAYRLGDFQQNEIPPASDQQAARVLRVIDGDTLLIDGDRRVRLIGVDTPETKHPKLPPQPFGDEATQFTVDMVEGRTVQLVFDKERYDRYQRILAFVFVDDRFLNEELVAAGLATAEPRYRYRDDFKKRFIEAEKIAKEKRLGIWSLEP